MKAFNTKTHFNELIDKAEEVGCRVQLIGGCTDFNYKGHTCYTKDCYYI